MDSKRVRSLSPDAAIAHIRRNPRLYVITPLGDVQTVRRVSSVRGDDDGGVDVLWAHKRAWVLRTNCFHPQRRFEGVENAIRGFVTGERSVDPTNFDLEHRLQDRVYNSSVSIDARHATTAA